MQSQMQMQTQLQQEEIDPKMKMHGPRMSVTGHGIEFVQPVVAPRRRLNSLSTPSVPRHGTQVQANVPLLPISVSRRGSIAAGSANASRRGSVVEGRLEGLGVGSGVSGPISIGIPVQRNKRRRVSRVGDVVEPQVSGDVSGDVNGESQVIKPQINDVSVETVERREIEITPLEAKVGKKTLFNKNSLQYEVVDIKGRSVEELSRQYESRAVRSIRELSGLRKEDSEVIGSLSIDAKSMSMRELCRPNVPFGAVSENYELAREGERNLEKGREYRRRVRETARQLRVSECEAARIVDSEGVKTEPVITTTTTATTTNTNTTTTTTTTAPVLELTQGKLTYAAESTVVDRRGDGNMNMNNSTTGLSRERIEENAFASVVTSATYAPRPVTSPWTPQEVGELLRAVAAFGTDFALIAELFPHRTRRQVKARFLLEEKMRPHLVEVALARRDVHVPLEEYAGLSKRAGEEMPTVESFDAEVRALRERHREEARALEVARANAHREDRERESATTTTGGTRRAVIAEFRKNEEVVGVLE